jgi:hypothetical protein
LAEDIELDYNYLTQRALRRVVFDALSLSAELGKPPGKHHFYIEFLTRADGVDIPADLLANYPERMTIVLQHQFEDLVVDDQGFSVTLFFKSRPARMTIPFEAVTSFADPGVRFGLRFEGADAKEAAPAESGPSPTAAAPAPKTEGVSKDSAEIVSLDKFRKK